MPFQVVSYQLSILILVCESVHTYVKFVTMSYTT